MSALVTLTPATTAMEERLAVLGIPVDRLIAAARIARSTWSAWRAGRTRPRPDRWAAVTAAFDALVAEATPAPAASAPTTLTGCSAPTGAPPSFTPIATAKPTRALDSDAADAIRRDLDDIVGPPNVRSEDPIPPLREEWRARYQAYCTNTASTNEEEDAVYDLVIDVERRAVASRATTLAGAIVSIEWARAEFADNMEDGLIGEELVLALLDGALGVLRDHSAAIPALPPPAVTSLEHAA